MSRFTLSLALFASLLAACTLDEGTTDTSAADDTAIADSGVPGADLDGTWVGACYERAQVVIRYDSLALTGTYTEYADDACTEAYHVSEWKGNAAVGYEKAPGPRSLLLGSRGERDGRGARGRDRGRTACYSRPYP